MTERNEFGATCPQCKGPMRKQSKLCLECRNRADKERWRTGRKAKKEHAE